MTKSSQIKKLVNGEIADADDVNQIVENAGTEGGAIPYEPTGHEQDEVGSQSLGSTAYPWGSLNINQDAELVEVDKDSHTVSDSVAIKNLRKFITLKDTPSAYSGYGGLPVLVKGDESGLEFKTYQASQLFTASGTFVVPTGVNFVFVSMVGGGGGGGGGYNGNGSGAGGGGGAYVIRLGVKVTAGGSYAVTVGAAGAAGADNAVGGNGGASSFVCDEGTLTCNGGSGGGKGSDSPPTGGAGGTSSFSTSDGVDASGTTGGSAGEWRRVTAGSAGGDGQGGDNKGGGGGASGPFGQGSAGADEGSDVAAVKGYGVGGGGGAEDGATSRAGAAGGSGMVYIEW